jgi:hypothetical protein
MSGCTTRIAAYRDAHIGVSQVACGSGYIVFASGKRVPITAMYDEDGDETEEVDDVVKVDFGDEDFGYGSLYVQTNPYPSEYLN